MGDHTAPSATDAADAADGPPGRLPADLPADLPDLDWPHVYRTGSPDAPVLLMLHGTGGNEQEIVNLAEALDLEATVLAPRGRVTEGGMLRWFRRLTEGVFDVDDVVRRSGELAEFIAWARRRYDLGGRRLVAVGFSNGANIALATALLHPEALDRVIAFSGMFPLDDRELGTDLPRTSVLLLSGRTDPMAPLASAIRVAGVLTARGARVEHELRDGGHGIAATDVAAARAWLTRPVSPGSLPR